VPTADHRPRFRNLVAYTTVAIPPRTNDTGHVAAFDRLVDRTLVEKISAARPVPGWDWVVAARLYIEDINTARRKLIIARLAWTLSVGLISTFLTVLIISGVQQHVGHDHLTGLTESQGLRPSHGIRPNAPDRPD